MSTTIQAYRWLEDQGFLEARAKSGFFICTPRPDLIPEPQSDTQKHVPRTRSASAIVAQVMRAVNDPACVPLGAGGISPEVLPNHQLNRILRGIVARDPLHSAGYRMPPGSAALRRQIARPR